MVSQLSKSQKYLWAAHAGAVVLVGAFAAYAFDAPDFFKGLPLGMLMVLVLVLFRRKLRDEYIERLWNAGTAAAFLAAIVSTVGVEMTRGFADRTADVFAVQPIFSPLAVGGIVLAAFLAEFHLAMWRDRP